MRPAKYLYPAEMIARQRNMLVDTSISTHADRVSSEEGYGSYRDAGNPRWNPFGVGKETDKVSDMNRGLNNNSHFVNKSYYY